MYPFERFTVHAKKVLTLAQEEAEQYGHGHIGTEHLLIGVLRHEEGTGYRELKALGVTLAQVRPLVEQVVPPAPDEEPASSADHPHQPDEESHRARIPGRRAAGPAVRRHRTSGSSGNPTPGWQRYPARSAV